MEEKAERPLNIPPFILASRSPRRKELLESVGLVFRVESGEIDEAIPTGFPVVEAAMYLAEKKAMSCKAEFPDEIVLAADTIVISRGKHLGKPSGESEAFSMLSELSGREHHVITGVCIAGPGKTLCFDDTTLVRFRELTSEEINYYIRNYKPFDKAGAYGIQEWIGMIGIREIRGSYFNVVGLPLEKVYSALLDYSVQIS